MPTPKKTLPIPQLRAERRRRAEPPKALPVILTTPEEYEIWLTAPADVALKLQRPLSDDMLEIVAKGVRSDQPEVA